MLKFGAPPALGLALAAGTIGAPFNANPGADLALLASALCRLNPSGIHWPGNVSQRGRVQIKSQSPSLINI